MYIENVSLHNINTLFDIAASNLEQKEMVGKMYDRNIVELYNQMSITLTISSLSFIVLSLEVLLEIIFLINSQRTAITVIEHKPKIPISRYDLTKSTPSKK